MSNLGKVGVVISITEKEFIEMLDAAIREEESKSYSISPEKSEDISRAIELATLLEEYSDGDIMINTINNTTDVEVVIITDYFPIIGDQAMEYWRELNNLADSVEILEKKTDLSGQWCTHISFVFFAEPDDVQDEQVSE